MVVVTSRWIPKDWDAGWGVEELDSRLCERCCDAALRHGDNPLAVGSFVCCVERAERRRMTGKGRWAALWEAVSLEGDCLVVVVVISWTERKKRNALEGFPGEMRLTPGRGQVCALTDTHFTDPSRFPLVRCVSALMCCYDGSFVMLTAIVSLLLS